MLETKINSEVFLNNLLKSKNSELQALSNQKLALEEKLIKLERQQSDRILKSPISGTILKLKIFMLDLLFHLAKRY